MKQQEQQVTEKQVKQFIRTCLEELYLGLIVLRTGTEESTSSMRTIARSLADSSQLPAALAQKIGQ